MPDLTKDTVDVQVSQLQFLFECSGSPKGGVEFYYDYITRKFYSRGVHYEMIFHGVADHWGERGACSYGPLYPVEENRVEEVAKKANPISF